MSTYARIMTELVNTPLLAHPRKAAIFLQFLQERSGGDVTIALPETPDAAAVDALRARPDASRFAGERVATEDGRNLLPLKLVGNVGIVTITGSMVNRGAWVGSYSGQTSYEGVGFQLDAAESDSRVVSVILDIETPGGQAIGAMETAARVRQLAKKKPVIAVVNGMAASAGYAIASGASRIVTTPSGVVGSIGVVLLHLDASRKLDRDGITPTLIYAGDHKVDGHSYGPLPDSVKADLKEEVDQLYELFLDTVAKGRGSATSRAAARDTQARTYIGKSAVEAKLADDVGTFEEVLADLRKSRRPAGSATASSSRSKATMDPTITQADHDRAVADAKTAGVAEGRTAGATAERERISSILAHAGVKGHEAFGLRMAAKHPAATADDVAEMCEGRAPAEAGKPAGRAPLSEREAETGAGKIEAGPEGGRQTGYANGADRHAGWDTAFKNRGIAPQGGRK